MSEFQIKRFLALMWLEKMHLWHDPRRKFPISNCTKFNIPLVRKAYPIL